MTFTFFERFGLLIILCTLLSVGGLLVYEKAHDADVKQDLIAAIEKGDAEEVKKLLDAGADANTVTTKEVNKPSVGHLLQCTLPDAARKRKTQQTTALMMAVMSKHAYLLTLLIDKGANVNAQDESGFTALGLAMSEGRLDMVQQLLEHGASPNIPNESHMPLIQWATLLREGPMVHALLDKGADPNTQDGNGMPTLYLACVDEDVPIVRLLLAHGANPKEVYKGWSVLRLAVIENNPEIVRALLARGADANEKLLDGRSLLQLAIEDKKTRVIPILKQPVTKQTASRDLSLSMPHSR